MLCYICYHAFDDNAVIMTARDYEDREMLCLNISSINAESNYSEIDRRRFEECSDVSLIENDSCFKKRDFN